MSLQRSMGSLIVPSPQVLYNNTSTLTVSGNSPSISTVGVNSVLLSVVVSALSGATPSLAVALDQQDAAGNWLYGVLALSTITNINSNTSYGAVGPGLNSTLMVTSAVRIRWTVSGSFTCTLSLIGR